MSWGPRTTSRPAEATAARRVRTHRSIGRRHGGRGRKRRRGSGERGRDRESRRFGCGEQRERYLRLAAEYDNYRKRSAKERSEAGTRAQADLVSQLIDALDDLARFAHVDPATTDAATVVQGVDMVEKKLLKALGGAGLEIINPVGETFDPALHEAVATEPASAKEDDHVVVARLSARIRVQVAAASARARRREAVERLTVFAR